MKHTKMLIFCILVMSICQFACGWVSVPFSRMKNAVHVYPGNNDEQDAYDFITSSDRDSHMGTLANDNRRTLVFTPGKYDSFTLTLDTDYVDIIGLGSVVWEAGASATMLDCGNKKAVIAGINMDCASPSSIFDSVTNGGSASFIDCVYRDDDITEPFSYGPVYDMAGISASKTLNFGLSGGKFVNSSSSVGSIVLLLPAVNASDTANVSFKFAQYEELGSFIVEPQSGDSLTIDDTAGEGASYWQASPGSVCNYDNDIFEFSVLLIPGSPIWYGSCSIGSVTNITW